MFLESRKKRILSSCRGVKVFHNKNNENKDNKNIQLSPTPQFPSHQANNRHRQICR